MSRFVDLNQHGLLGLGAVHDNLGAPILVEMALARHEAQLTETGALTALTGKRTGRSPKDKFIVQEPSVESSVDWGRVNQPMPPEVFAHLLKRRGSFCAAGSCLFRIAMPAQIPPIASISASSPRKPGTRSSRNVCFVVSLPLNIALFSPIG